MRSEKAIIAAGAIMITAGLLSFYSIQSNPNLDHTLRLIKHSGTFVGLMGIGVTMAGILLYLISRNRTPVQENYDVN